jgi:hypothetical protein
MVRWLWILATGLLIALPAMGDEPARPGRLVLVHGGEAHRWLACLGKNIVRVEPLVPGQPDANEWAAAERQVRRLDLPDAFVSVFSSDDLLPRFWSDRLRNQGSVEVVVHEFANVRDAVEQERQLIRRTHQLLLKLCPEAKATLDERMSKELLRRSLAKAASEALASR